MQKMHLTRNNKEKKKYAVRKITENSIVLGEGRWQHIF